MSLPSEYVIEDAVRSIDDVIVYRANHPIHGKVNVYQPDGALPPDLARVVKKHLYQKGLQMRNLSLLNVPFTAKALEVSQNPNEPYVVTKYVKYSLEELISNGVTIKPKRMFAILSQVLDTTVNLAANGWVIDHVHPRQVKLPELLTGDISFTVIEGAEQQTDAAEMTAAAADDNLGDAVTPQADAKEDRTLATPVRITQRTDETQTPNDTAAARTAPRDVDRTVTLDENTRLKNDQKQLRTRQRNIYRLGNITYQLLFGRKYLSSDKLAVANIRKLGRRWRRILEKALSQSIHRRYDTYETMLRDVKRASNRNKRMAIASLPFLLLLVLIGSYFTYERYHQYKIMTSPAWQAIKSLLDIVNKTDSEFPELEKPAPPSPEPDDQTILKPFDEIESVDED
jgi:hypothetical protein